MKCAYVYGEPRTSNANDVRLFAWEHLGMLLYYNENIWKWSSDTQHFNSDSPHVH